MITVNSISRTHVVTDNGKIPFSAFKKSHKDLQAGKSYVFTVLNDEILDYYEVEPKAQPE